MQKERICIVIPLYKKISDEREKASLKQGLTVFRDYDIFVICPETFNETWLDEYKNLHPKIHFKKFPSDYFLSPNTYNSLMLNPEFYEGFADYEFMLIYQTDAYVFRDELPYWCDKGFDFIGAPWFKNFDYTGKETEFLPHAGNGGFCLRSIKKINLIMKKKLSFSQMLKLAEELRKTRSRPHNKITFTIKFFAKFFTKKNTLADFVNCIRANTKFANEDYFYAEIYPSIFPEFKPASAIEAVPFSFECQPEILFKMNGEKLPFGCHAWFRYAPEFWQRFIKF